MRENRAKILKGDRKAFRRFYEETCGELTGYVQMKVAGMKDAEEIVQDTYLSFLDSLPLHRGEASLKTFLFAIARHEVADFWRKRYAKKAIKTVPFMNQVYSERLYSSAELGAAIEATYAKLTQAEAQLLRLKYERGMSVEEIAKTLEISIKAAESRLFRARRAFQLVYAKEAA
jgi:RNA polymerase sigma-70 factor, ECF subfamily